MLFQHFRKCIRVFIAALMLLSIKNEAVVHFAPTTSVNRAANTVSLQIIGPPGAEIAIDSFNHPSTRYGVDAPTLYWAHLLNITLDANGTGNATVNVQNSVLGMLDVFKNLHYGVWRASVLSNNSRVEFSTNAYVALYGTYDTSTNSTGNPNPTNTYIVAGLSANAKPFSQIFVNPYNGLQAFTMDANGSYVTSTYSTILGGWIYDQTVQTGTGFMARVPTGHTVQNLEIDLSGFFDETLISVPLPPNGYRLLSGSHVVAVYTCPPDYFAIPYSEFTDAYGVSTFQYPAVDGDYFYTWDYRYDSWFSTPTGNYDSAISDWSGVYLHVTEAVSLYNTLTNTGSFTFTRPIW